MNEQMKFLPNTCEETQREDSEVWTRLCRTGVRVLTWWQGRRPGDSEQAPLSPGPRMSIHRIGGWHWWALGQLHKILRRATRGQESR